MGGTELAIVQLGTDHAHEGLILSTEAHWNQNEADWRFFLTKGTVFGIRDGQRAINRNRGAAALHGRATPGSAWCW